MVPVIGEVLHTSRASSENYPGKECLHICSDDLRDACKTAEIASSSGFEWGVQYTPDSLFKDRTGIRTVGDFDGINQILLTRAYAQLKCDGQLIFIAKVHKQTLETG